MPEIIKVKCVYGDIHRISKDDYQNTTKTQLPFYTRNGNRFCHTVRGERAFKQGKCISIHRLNIKEVL